MAKDVIITLNVEAATLTNYECPTQQEIDDSCTLSDNNEGSTNSGPENFESTVYKDKNVTWQGHSYDDGFVVAITGIIYDSGVQMFKNEPPFSGDGTNESSIEQKIKNDKDYEGHTETYTINFSISNSLKTWGPYSIDPKIKMPANN